MTCIDTCELAFPENDYSIINKLANSHQKRYTKHTFKGKIC